MKLVLDTNVLVSSIFWKGDSFRIMDLINNGSVKLILSQEIIDELKIVLDSREIQDKIKEKNLEVLRSLDQIISLAVIINPLNRIQAVKEDPDDNKILECALEGNVDYVITKDNHLLKIKEFEGIRIMTPEHFLQLF